MNTKKKKNILNKHIDVLKQFFVNIVLNTMLVLNVIIIKTNNNNNLIDLTPRRGGIIYIISYDINIIITALNTVLVSNAKTK